jgi:hypothetical protein
VTKLLEATYERTSRRKRNVGKATFQSSQNNPYNFSYNEFVTYNLGQVFMGENHVRRLTYQRKGNLSVGEAVKTI